MMQTRTINNKKHGHDVVTYTFVTFASLWWGVGVGVGEMGKWSDLTIVAAFLTIVGYSLNDTIVVFDRIRENVVKHARESLDSIVNISLNRTLGRTIVTSLTTFVVVFSLFLFGGEVIKNFAFALIVGIFVGTYSSIYVASPVMMYFEKKAIAKK